ncbi:uncharacterized protein LOC134652758 [Cydia amplana]|uniref:uncharacterized protein LOC134652758 n=1 Tax=Cydia amplana TaxID=1869771 RepID=UPI002FE5C963
MLICSKQAEKHTIATKHYEHSANRNRHSVRSVGSTRPRIASRQSARAGATHTTGVCARDQRYQNISKCTNTNTNDRKDLRARFCESNTSKVNESRVQSKRQTPHHERAIIGFKEPTTKRFETQPSKHSRLLEILKIAR